MSCLDLTVNCSVASPSLLAGLNAELRVSLFILFIFKHMWFLYDVHTYCIFHIAY